MWIIIFEADEDEVNEVLGCEPETESENESKTESENESENESEDESENESELETESRTINYFVECPSEKVRPIPLRIFEGSAWHALTIKLDGFQITPKQIKNVPDCDSVEARQVYPSRITVHYDSHWDCYCKTQDVCGCGCDPMHDGW